MSINNEKSKIPIDVSAAAANKVKQLIRNKNLATETNFLRVYVTGGGCSGFQYGFMLDDKVAEDDTKIWYEETGFLVDSLSYQYLCGAVIDYEESLSGSKFIVKNPNAKTTCGCGASFSL